MQTSDMQWTVRIPASATRSLLLWTIIPLVGAATCALIAHLLPPRYPPYVVPHARSLHPGSGAYSYLVLMDPQTPGLPRNVSACVFLANSVPLAEVDIHLPDLAYQAYVTTQPAENSEPQTGILTPDAILSLMRSAHVNVESATVHSEADELVSLLRRLASGADLESLADSLKRFRVTRVGTTNPNRSPLQEFLHASPAIWSIVWFIGLVVILRRTPPAPVDLTRCQTCGYDLTGNTSGVCPECGLAVSQDATRCSTEIG